MKRILLNVYLAQRIGEEETPHLCIEGTREFPALPLSTPTLLNDHMALFRAEAKALCDALYATLPGGTLDQLLREMLERKASHFVVKF